MASKSEVILTGTGTPLPVPGRAGPGVLVRANGVHLQFDAGRATSLRLIEAGVAASDLDVVFLTHHHSDHVVGLADLLMTSWLLTGEPLTVVAPFGASHQFAGEVLAPFAADIAIRNHHRGRSGHPQPNVHGFEPDESPQIVWKSGDVTVSAVLVRHEPVRPAVGYRVDTPDGAVVISGDTRACEAVERLATGVHVLVHEVIKPDFVPPDRLHTIDYHAPALEVGALAGRAGVRTLVLTHLWPAPSTEEDVAAYVADVRAGGFTGELITGIDLTRVDIGTRE